MAKFVVLTIKITGTASTFKNSKSFDRGGIVEYLAGCTAARVEQQLCPRIVSTAVFDNQIFAAIRILTESIAATSDPDAHFSAGYCCRNSRTGHGNLLTSRERAASCRIGNLPNPSGCRILSHWLSSRVPAHRARNYR